MTRRTESNDFELPFNLPQTPEEYVNILRFRWYWVVAGLIVGAVASQISVQFVPEQFISRTVVLVESDAIPDSLVPRMGGEDARDRLTTIHEEILARPRIERILEDLNPYPEMIDVPRAQVVDMVRSRTGIGLRGREAFVVEFTDTDPERAQLMASRLASLFIEQTSGDRAAQALDANQFIEAQLEETKRDLDDVEARLRVIKSRNIGMLPNQLNANLATLERLELQRQSMATEIRGATDRRDLIERQLALQTQMNEPEAQLIPELSAATPASGEPSTLSQLRLYLEQLKTRYTDAHPEVQAVRARIERLEKEAATEEIPIPDEVLDIDEAMQGLDVDSDADTESILDTTEPRTSFAQDIMVTDLRSQVAAATRDLELLRARYAELQQEIATYQARVEKIPEVEQQLQTLERDYELISGYYSELLSRKLQAETAGAVERKWQEQFSIIDPAQVPDSPSSPNATLFLLAGTGLGLGVGVLGAFLLEVIDPSVKSLRELESLLPYPVLLTLPAVKVKNSRREAIREPIPPAPPSKQMSGPNDLSAAS